MSACFGNISNFYITPNDIHHNDQILDIEDPFESLEPILPEEVYPIMVLAMINNIRSDTVMDALTEGFYKGIKRYMKEENG